MTNTIYDKTEKGREEISTRKHHLAPRLRTLLVMIDGKHDTNDLLKKVGTIGIDEQSVNELFALGFIAPANGQAPAFSPEPPAAPPMAQADETPVDAVEEDKQKQAPSSILPPGENQFQAIYHFYNETIKSTIGLRGYGLQLKVERAGSIDDFRAIRQPYLDAVLKAKGSEMARSLGNRLDQLLNLEESPSGDTGASEEAKPVAAS
ncbi:MAG TPA: hypothetical protein VGU61_01245 [Noviherbaspirillum sp.]|jgi:hypothetical protein|uniref:hypothetical protein n=1 Tax=Noviherbaspirillum sp. TaxID=1926288 RepID=UPI002DDCDA44|nr:hypothetical protein [Noviherbaspirillum sp.]HEV2608862.1 hypothetical protein [Noviherbaspirillum sp.]